MSYPGDPTLEPDLPECPECDSDQVEETDEGSIKGHKYYEFKCINCGHTWSSLGGEDIDQMPGGHDDDPNSYLP